LGPLGTAATKRPIMPAPGDYDDGKNDAMMDDWQGKPKYSEKTCPSAALSTTNPTCCPDANPGRRCRKPATNRLSYGTALSLIRRVVICTSMYVHIYLAATNACSVWRSSRGGLDNITYTQPATRGSQIAEYEPSVDITIK
jgi:hypothetical protein